MNTTFFFLGVGVAYLKGPRTAPVLNPELLAAYYWEYRSFIYIRYIDEN